MDGQTFREERTMYSQDHMNAAAHISQFVIENGRVLTDDEGNLDLESLRVEVEFECGERGLEDCTEIAAAAVELAQTGQKEDIMSAYRINPQNPNAPWLGKFKAVIGTADGQYFASDDDFFAAYPEGEITSSFHNSPADSTIVDTRTFTHGTYYHVRPTQPAGEWHALYQTGPVVELP